MTTVPFHPSIVWVLRIQFLVLIVAATYTCLTPRPQELIPFSVWDKGLHFFGWLGIFLSLRIAMLLAHWVKRSGVGVFIYSAILEGLQAFVPGRQFELHDLLANGLGIFTGMLLWYLLMKIPRVRSLTAGSPVSG